MNHKLIMNKMKTTLMILLFFSMISCSNSQNISRDFSHFYDKYQDDAGIVSFTIPSFLANMAIDDNDQDAKKVLKKLNKLRFFICEKDNGFYNKTINTYLPENVYHDLLVVKDGPETVTFKMKEPEKEKIKEIILLVTKPDSFVAISFSGDFNLEEAQEMTSSINAGKLGQMRE